MTEIETLAVITLTLLVISLLYAWINTLGKLKRMTKCSQHQKETVIKYHSRWEQSSKKKSELEEILLQVNDLITEAINDE